MFRKEKIDIVGAGIAGIATAVRLASLSARIVDKLIEEELTKN